MAKSQSRERHEREHERVRERERVGEEMGARILKEVVIGCIARRIQKRETKSGRMRLSSR